VHSRLHFTAPEETISTINGQHVYTQAALTIFSVLVLLPGPGWMLKAGCVGVYSSSMKVAIDVHSLGTQAGGNETFHRQLVQGLAQLPDRHQYILFYTQPQVPAAFKLDERFAWKQIPANPLRRIAISLPGLVRELRPNVFHCQYILPPRIKTATVITIHDLAHEHYPEFSPRLEGFRMRRLVPWSARRADHIITVSEYSAADISRTYGIPRDRITVVYPSPHEKFQPRDKETCRAHLKEVYGLDAPFILYVGRVQVRKNLIRLAEAYGRVRRQHPELKLVIVGKPDLYYERLLARIDELGLKKCVVFSGYVPGDDLPLFYNAAEMFVFPSMFEGFGLPVMESMASGVPAITSQGSCLAEVAGDGALLVDPASVASIADAIQQVLDNSALRRGLIERGLRRTASFRKKSFAETILRVYESLI
jgi:glycosyltransferase involved in cell wall biosynthesis